jgi:voltage-gated potassium channel
MITMAAPPERNAHERLADALRWPMAILALAVIPALLLDGGEGPLHTAATVTNWIVWVAFVGEFAALLALAPNKADYIRTAWFELFLIVLTPPFAFVPEAWQGLRAARAIRILRLLRAFGFLGIGLKVARRLLKRHSFHYVLIATVGVIVLGAAGIFVLERHTNEAITSVGDALWWAVSTTTTVGYGDIYPTTGEGRVIAVVLMLTGIGVIGTFTATIASWFFAQDEGDDIEALQQRLERMELKIDALLRERQSRREDIGEET